MLVTIPLGSPPVGRTVFIECASADVVESAYPTGIIHGVQHQGLEWFGWGYRSVEPKGLTSAEIAELASHNIEPGIRTTRSDPSAHALQVINEKQAQFEPLLPLDILTAEARTLVGAGTGNPVVYLGYRSPNGYLIQVQLPVADTSYTWFRLTENGTGRSGSGDTSVGVSEDLIAHLRGFLSEVFTP